MQLAYRKYRWLAIGIFVIGVLGLSVLLIRYDIEGNDKIDVARSFVDAVQKKDYVEAAKYWKQGDIRNLEANWKTTFALFCQKEFACDHYSLRYGGYDKVHIVLFEGQQDGRTKTFNLYINRADWKWRLREDSWGLN